MHVYIYILHIYIYILQETHAAKAHATSLVVYFGRFVRYVVLDTLFWYVAQVGGGGGLCR